MWKSGMVIVLAVIFPLSVDGQDTVLAVSDRLSQAIVQIHTEDGIGTGFIVEKHGTIVTALSVIDEATRVEVRTETMETFDNVSLLAKDHRRNIGIIRVPGRNLATVELDESENSDDRPVLMIGRPLAMKGPDLFRHPGRVLGVTHSDRGHKILSVDQPIPPEVLGGPLLNKAGKAIAVAVIQNNSMVAIPINDVLALKSYAKETEPILQWESGTVSQNPWHRFLLFWKGLFYNFWIYHPWFIVVMAVGGLIYSLVSLRYSRLARGAETEPWLAPVSVTGKHPTEFSPFEAAIVLDAQMSKLAETTARKRSVTSKNNIASLSGADLHGEMIGLLVNAPIDVQLHQHQLPAVELPELAEIGIFKIPIGLIAKLVKRLFGKIPMRSRDRYRKNLIYVCLMSFGQEAHLLVWRHDRYLTSTAHTDSEESNPKSFQTEWFPKNAAINLLRDAVFMILELTQDKAIPGRSWVSKKHFVDGLECVDESLRTGKRELLNSAISSIFCAAEADDENYEALYIKGHFLGARRDDFSNALAVELLTRSLNTEKPRLRALAHAGLANAYAQQYFRLAKRKAEVCEQARSHVERAYGCWKDVQDHHGHPWIIAADAFVLVLEAMSTDGEERTELYHRASKLYYQALSLEVNNSAYSNALGFTLLRLAEQGQLEDDLSIPPSALNVPQKSEYYFQVSLEMDPSNKLTHANLCLLYAIEWYRRENYEKYLEQCREHGLKAVELDPHYINGYRDLALSLLRYGERQEAFSNYKKAMDLAKSADKKKEIQNEVDRVLLEVGVSIENWSKGG